MTIEAIPTSSQRYVLVDTTSASAVKVGDCRNCSGTSGGCSICALIKGKYDMVSRELLLSLGDFATPAGLALTVRIIDGDGGVYTYQPARAALSALLEGRFADWVLPDDAPKPASVELQVDYQEKDQAVSGAVAITVV